MHALCVVWSSHLASSARHAGRCVDVFMYYFVIHVRPCLGAILGVGIARVCSSSSFQGQAIRSSSSRLNSSTFQVLVNKHFGVVVSGFRDRRAQVELENGTS